MKKNKLACDKCGRLVWIRSKGLCQFCAPKKLYTTSAAKVVKRKKEIHDFFTEIKEQLIPVSVESGIRISELSKVNMAHILPKNYYHSVERDIANILVLTWGEHSRFDELLDKRDVDALRREFPHVCQEIRKRLTYLNETCKEQGRALKLINEL